MQVWNLLHAARWKYRTQKLRKKSPSAHHRTTLSGYIFAIKPCIDNWRKLLTSNISSTSSHNMVNVGSPATNGWDRFGSLGNPSKFQRVSRLGFVTAPTSLSGGQPNFAGCLAVIWAATLCIHFGDLLPLTEFCQVQNSLCVKVLRCLILAALLHGTLRRGIFISRDRAVIQFDIGRSNWNV